MKNLLVILYLFLGLNAFAQSKRKVDEQLMNELMLVKLKYDSIITSATQKEEKMEALQANYVAAELRNEQRQATNIRNDLDAVQRSYEQLQRLGKDASGVTDLMNLKDEVGFFEFDVEKSRIDRTCISKKGEILSVTSDTLLIKKRKRKEQNEWLNQQLETYLSANKTNLLNITEIDNCSTIIVKARPGLDSLYWKYENALYDLAVELHFLRDTIEKLKEFSLSDWPKNFTSVYEKEFGMPIEEKLEILNEYFERSYSPTGIRHYRDRLKGEYIHFANAIPIEKFSPEIMKKQGQVLLKTENAQYPGGSTEMRKFLMKNLHYPPKAEEIGLEGKCYLKFQISKAGEISDIKVMRGVPECKECDQEAIRVIHLMPKWIPASEGGRKADSYYQLPLTFKIQ